MKKVDLSHLATLWPSDLVARKKVGAFTGGIISPSTIANLDAIGKGPKGRTTVGQRKVFYPKDLLVEWLVEWLESRANKM